MLQMNQDRRMRVCVVHIPHVSVTAAYLIARILNARNVPRVVHRVPLRTLLDQLQRRQRHKGLEHHVAQTNLARQLGESECEQGRGRGCERKSGCEPVWVIRVMQSERV